MTAQLCLPIEYYSASGKYALWGSGIGFITLVACGVTTREIMAGRAPDNMEFIAIGLGCFAVFSSIMLWRAVVPRVAFRLDDSGLIQGRKPAIDWAQIESAEVIHSDGETQVVVLLKPSDEDEANPTQRDEALRGIESALFRNVKMSTSFAKVSAEQLAAEINHFAGASTRM